MQAISVQELHNQFEDFLVVDVREKWEWDIAHIKGSIHIPSNTLATQYGELDKKQAIAVVCHHGRRSAQAAVFLLQHGFSAVYNVNGGIDAWSKEIDPSVSLY